MKFQHIALTVNNLEESIDFYIQHFGFVLVDTFTKPEINAKFCYLELKGFQIELFEFSSMKDNSDDLSDLAIRGIRHIAFEVEDIKETFEDFKTKGLDITEPKKGSSGSLISFISDPSGIKIELNQPV